MKNNLLEITILSTFYVKNPKIFRTLRKDRPKFIKFSLELVKLVLLGRKLVCKRQILNSGGGGQKNFVIRIT